MRFRVWTFKKFQLSNQSTLSRSRAKKEKWCWARWPQRMRSFSRLKKMLFGSRFYANSVATLSCKWSRTTAGPKRSRSPDKNLNRSVRIRPTQTQTCICQSTLCSRTLMLEMKRLRTVIISRLRITALSLSNKNRQTSFWIRPSGTTTFFNCLLTSATREMPTLSFCWWSHKRWQKNGD